MSHLDHQGGDTSKKVNLSQAKFNEQTLENKVLVFIRLAHEKKTNLPLDPLLRIHDKTRAQVY